MVINRVLLDHFFVSDYAENERVHFVTLLLKN